MGTETAEMDPAVGRGTSRQPSTLATGKAGGELKEQRAEGSEDRGFGKQVEFR